MKMMKGRLKGGLPFVGQRGGGETQSIQKFMQMVVMWILAIMSAQEYNNPFCTGHI